MADFSLLFVVDWGVRDRLRLVERERLRLRDLDRLRERDKDEPLDACDSGDLDCECLRLCESGDERFRLGDTDRETERFFTRFSLIII